MQKFLIENYLSINFQYYVFYHLRKKDIKKYIIKITGIRSIVVTYIFFISDITIIFLRML